MPKLCFFRLSAGRGLILATGLVVCVSPCLSAERETKEPSATIRFSAVSALTAPPVPLAEAGPQHAGAANLLKPAVRGESFLFSQYRMALERESRRMADRHPTLFTDASVDEDGYPLRGSDRVQRDARRLFGGAGSRVMSGFVDKLLDASAGGRAARGAIEGLRFDVRRGGGLGVGAGPALESSRDVKASVGVQLLGRPRVEVKSTLPGNLRTRLEIPLDSLGFRATLSHRFPAGWRGTFTAGSEEDDRWISAGFEVDF